MTAMLIVSPHWLKVWPPWRQMAGCFQRDDGDGGGGIGEGWECGSMSSLDYSRMIWRVLSFPCGLVNCFVPFFPGGGGERRVTDARQRVPTGIGRAALRAALTFP